METPDLRATQGAAPLGRDVVVVTGPEAIDFLQGQLSQDVAALAEGQSRPSLLLQPTGKVDAWLRVTRLEGDAALLDVDLGFGEAVRDRLNRFKLRTKVDLELSSWRGLALRGPGAPDVEAPSGVHALAVEWPGASGLDLLSDGEIALAGVAPASSQDLEALRVECGVPAMGAELTDSTIPAEAGQWLIDASVSFTKGCYTGQELVARIDSRGGRAPRPVRGLLVDGEAAPVGAVVTFDEQGEIGTVTSSAVSPHLGAIALAPLGRMAEPGQRVRVRDGAYDSWAVVVALPFER